METAAVAKLKASLSEYLAKVKAGQEVIVTERGKPIARIVPLDREAGAVSAHVLALERAGLAAVGTGRLPEGFWMLPRVKDKKGLALKVLAMEREEGR